MLLEQLGFPVAIEKREGPATTLEFLELEVDSGAMEIRLPASKLEEIDSLLQQWRGRKVASRRELDSLVGKLARASQVVQPGKTFLRRFFELQKGVRRPYHKIRLGGSIQSDIRWWSPFMKGWNGVTIIRRPRETSPGACVDGCIGAVWLWRGGSRDRGLATATVA